MALPSPPRDFARTTLGAHHGPLVRALAEAMLAHADGPTPARLDALVAEIDAFVSFASQTLRFGLLLMLEVLRFAPVLLLFRVATFGSLPREERVEVLERMEQSRLVVLTLVFAAWKSILCFVFFEHPEELAASGYSRVRRRHDHALPLVHAEAAE